MHDFITFIFDPHTEYHGLFRLIEAILIIGIFILVWVKLGKPPKK